MTSRKEFIKKTLIGSSLLLTGGFPFESFCMPGNRLTILHTNDTHSRLTTFTSAGFEGQGGIANRAHIIEQIRKKEENVLLLDAGDFIHAHPGLSICHGTEEIKMMNKLGYDAATIGNHDFDIGVERFAQLSSLASFHLLAANYDFRNTAMDGKTKPYIIIEKAGCRIGIFGLGIDLKGLVSDNDCRLIKYSDALSTANVISHILKKEEMCDMIICVSHLGYEYTYPKISDKIIAKETAYIDLIIGGHTHTFLNKPFIQNNKVGKEVVINQVGWGGLRLGRLDFVLDSKKSSKLFNSQSVIVSKQTIE